MTQRDPLAIAIATPMRAPPQAQQDPDLSREAMQASRIGMALIDMAGTLVEVNPALARLLGVEAAELIGQPLAVLANSGNGVATADSAPAFAAPDGAATQQRCRHRDGSVIWVEATVDLITSARGTAPYQLLQVRDITSQHALEAGLQSRAREHADALEAAHRQLQLFADAVSHDLRAPLRTIESFSGLLAGRASERLDETDQDYLRRIRAGAQRMGGLLHSLSELSGVLRADIKPTCVDLSLLAEWVGAELCDAEPTRPARITVQPGLAGRGDERLLKQLLTHVMGNAWKFSRARDCASIDVEGERVGDILRLTVRDAGIGFDANYTHKLFEPFQRLHGVEQGGGHGLGLAIAQRIAQRHGGGITGQSPPGGGATFVVELPAATAQDAPDA